MGFKADVVDSLGELERQNTSVFCVLQRNQEETRQQLVKIDALFTGSKISTILREMEHGIAATAAAGEGLQYVKEFICVLQRNQEDIIKNAKAAEKRTAEKLQLIDDQLAAIIKHITHADEPTDRDWKGDPT